MLFPAAANFAMAPTGVALDICPPVLEYTPVIEDQGVDVSARGENVIETAVSYVVGPAVTSEDPDTPPDEVVRNREKLGRVGVAALPELFLELIDPLPLFFYLGLFLLGIRLYLLEESRVYSRRFGGKEPVYQLVGIGNHPVGGKSHAHAELGGVLEQGVGPCRSPSVVTLCVRRRGQVASVDG